MLKIALVGNIASGKTTVENILKNNGFAVYDTDKMAHEILDKSELAKKEFPSSVINGKIDRKILAGIVFNNPDKLKLLESIIHPEVKKEILKISDKVAFVSIPQLFEANMQSLFDKIIFISASEETRLKRLMSRNNLSLEDAVKRINAQMDEAEKIKKSDFVIYNNGTQKELETQVLSILSNIC